MTAKSTNEIFLFENTQPEGTTKSDTFTPTGEFRVVIERQAPDSKAWLYGENATPMLLKDNIDLAGNSGEYWLETSGECLVRVFDLE